MSTYLGVTSSQWVCYFRRINAVGAFRFESSPTRPPGGGCALWVLLSSFFYFYTADCC